MMHSLTLQEHLRQSPALQYLTSAEIEQLAPFAQLKTAPKHSFIYLADEPSTYMCLLLKGLVKTGIFAPDGREIIKNIFHPLSIFGEAGLTGEQVRGDFSSSVNQAVQYIALPVSEFQAIMQQNFLLMQSMMLYQGDRLRRAEHQWESLILKDVRARIVEYLKETAGQLGRRVGFETVVKHGLTQQDLANLVGASRQTVAAVLGDMRRSNLIHFTRDSILIRDMEKLN
jgi:CRP/FNR family transcriptional regulator, cyclic AMP receptor protein